MVTTRAAACEALRAPQIPRESVALFLVLSPRKIAQGFTSLRSRKSPNYGRARDTPGTIIMGALK